MFAYIQRVSTVKSLFFALLLGLMAGCSDDNSDPIGGISGTGVLLQGTVQNARAFVSNDVQIKVQGNPVVQVSINSQGEYSAADLPSDAPYLLRVDFTSGAPFYALTYAQNGRQNIHAYSDLVIRNWYASQGQDIDDIFETGLDIFPPTESQLLQSINLINNLLGSVLAEYNLSGVDLSTAEYLSDDQGVDEFLDSNPVIIVNGDVNIIVTNPDTNLQTSLTSGLSLETDLSLQDMNPPSLPNNLRALTTEDFEIVLAWEASTDDIGVSQYEILRDGVVIDTSTFPAFIDSTVETGEMYTYTVVAIDASGNRSVQSAPATAEIVVDVTAPPAPENVTFIPSTDSIRIDWDQDSIFDVSSFTIFSNSEEIASTTSTFAYQVDLPSGTQFCYEVIAVDGSGNRSLPSAESCTMTLSSGAIVTPAVEVVAPMPDEPVVSAPTNASIVGAWGGIVTGPDGELPLVFNFEAGAEGRISGSFDYPSIRQCEGSMGFVSRDESEYEFSQNSLFFAGGCSDTVRVNVMLNTVGTEQILDFQSFGNATGAVEYFGTLRRRTVSPDSIVIGDWGGILTGPDGDLPLVLNIDSIDGDKISGSFDYPTIRSCEGSIDFVTNLDGVYEFSQDSLFFAGGCSDTVRVNMTPTMEGTQQVFEFQSFNTSTGVVNSGILRLRTIDPESLVVGSWGGVVMSTEGPVQLLLELEVDSSGRLSGIFDYPTIRSCEGSIDFVTNLDGFYEFSQDSLFFAGGCSSTIRINLTFPTEETIEFTSYDPVTNEIDAEGTLRRQ